MKDDYNDFVEEVIKRVKEIGKLSTQEYDNTTKKDVPEMDYKMECDRLWKENHTQDTIIKALVFYIQEARDE